MNMNVFTVSMYKDPTTMAKVATTKLVLNDELVMGDKKVVPYYIISKREEI